MDRKAIKYLILFSSVIYSTGAQAVVVTPVWQNTHFFFYFLATASFLTAAFFFARKKQTTPNFKQALLWRNVPDIITEIDIEGTILSINKVAPGFVEKDVIGQSSFDFLADKDKEIFSKALDAAITSHQVQRYEIEVITPEGDTLYMFNRIVPNLIKRKIVSLLVITTDITEQKQAHAILVKSKNQAEQANAAKSQFLASMSHEIRTPMTGMLGMASLLEQTELTTEQYECVNTIQTSAEHLLSIVNDVLDLSKIEANKLTIECENFDVHQLVNGLVMTMGSKAREKGLNLQVFINPTVPRFVVGDTLRIRQILMNFLSNSIKFTMNGHVIIRIVVIQMQNSTVSLRFSVEDSGIGMEPDKAAVIFDEYTDAHGMQSAQMGGTGLGLNICHRLAEMMSGSVGVVSTPNLGSNFWLDLEMAIAHESDLSSREETVGNDRALPTGLMVWVVDEIKVNRLLMKEVAKGLGFIVREFNQTADVRRAIDNGEAPDLIVFSYELGESKRRQLISQISEIQTSVYVAMTTVESINLNYDELAEQGIHAFWEWPLSRPELVSIVERVFDHNWETQPNTLITRYKRTLTQAKETIGGRGKILLAEDNLVNQKVASQMLMKMGFEVDIANDGEEALAAWKRDRYDVILMDCHMPVMDGLQATRMIRMQEDQSHTPILALTADVLTDRKAECIKAGMDGFMSKPIRIEELRQTIKEYL